ncbi:MAG: phosphoribosylformylglycinamidine synthase [Kiritimatiellae bacterium]|nr:phosphoribosylformylglycinamidine synthase [Kiritimatiellia bacterium]
MSFRIEIGLKRGVRDPRGERVEHQARTFLKLPVRRVRTRDVYLVDMDLPPRDCSLVREAFADLVIARPALGRLPPPAGFDWLIEVGFKPGVTDNVGATARTVLADVLQRPEADCGGVFSSVQYFVQSPGMRRDAAQALASGLLANPLIQTIRIYSPEDWTAAPVDAEPPLIREPAHARVRTIPLEGGDDELRRISREGILSLSLEEMRAIRDHYRRPEVRAARSGLGLPPDAPTDVELECLAQTWSEHCKHKIFAARVRYTDETGRTQVVDGLFKTYIRGATEAIRARTDRLVSVFTDNAGIVRFNDRWHVAYKCETHNSPSALDPYGGAITGIVGVNRDPMGTGLGCELICNVWGYCLGSPFHEAPLPEGLMHPRRIRDGVHHGVIDGGNQSGIPWARGFERFDDRYIGKPLVYCGTIGRIPVTVNGIPSETKDIRPGDFAVMCGGRIGKDGIHGATFSSEELHQESPAQAVQIGDAFTQRKLYEFIIEARDLGLYRALTDNGAGGLSSSIGEMCTLSGGAELDLGKAPLKYQGLDPWEIWLSEAQERMSVAVPPEKLDAFMDLARRRDVEASALGTFTRSGALILRHGDRIVGRLELDFLHDGCPRLELDARWTPPQAPVPSSPRGRRRDRALRALLGRLNVCSKEHKSRCYDGEVKGLSVVKPFVGVNADMPADATVMRIEHGGREGIAMAEGINPFLSDLDTRAMMASVIDEAVRRIVSAGGPVDLIAGLDNFCWPDPVVSERNPDGAYKMAQLVRANQALYDVTTAYGVPCVSGKDSMKNDSLRGGVKISIPPTVLFSTLGVMPEVDRAVTMDVKRASDAVYVLGLTRDERGASEYHRWLAHEQGRAEAFGGQAPALDTASALALYRAMNRATDAGLLRSSHTPTLGGLAVAFALTALGGQLGIEADLSALPCEEPLAPDARLFSESNARFIVTCAPERTAELESCFAGLPCARVGTVTTESRLRLTDAGGRTLIDQPLAVLRRAFRQTLANL